MRRREEEILNKLRSGDELVLKQVYKDHRDDFVAWASRSYSLEPEEAKDIFQTTIMAFYENAVSGKLTQLSCELKTYLFSIAKHHIQNFIRKKGAAANLDDVPPIKVLDSSWEEEETQAYNKTLVHQAIAQLPLDHQKILELFYFRDYDMASIAREMGYKNESVAKVKKSQCLRKLSVILKESIQLLKI